jgi:hypothetical protein
LKNLLNIFEKENFIDFNEMYSALIYLFNENRISAQSHAIEIIIRGFVRSLDNIIERPDFSFSEMPPYQILKLNSAILNSPSVTNSLAFERIENQLLSTNIFSKEKKSEFDIFFGG